MKSRGVSICSSSVYNYLKLSNLKYQTPLKRILINEVHKNKRFIWALEHKEFNWSNSIFTDESTFYLYESKGPSWGYKNKRDIELKKTHPLKLNVWGCFSKNGFGKLYFFEEILESNLMIKIYKEALIPSINMMFGDKNNQCVVIEDNDPKHKSKICRNFKDQNSINVLPWPSNSPDLNPIENVWGLLKLKIRAKQPRSIIALKKLINKEWKSFDNSYCENLITSMENRISSCIAAEGDYICY